MIDMTPSIIVDISVSISVTAFLLLDELIFYLEILIYSRHLVSDIVHSSDITTGLMGVASSALIIYEGYCKVMKEENNEKLLNMHMNN